ncbi:hypothetical protein DPMN_080488 [Dreissena polymorpha]|uniref:Uncharacterized protein n=1 Tax=Dreissena polymorpha TaxID=45954 RepID=A0A9D3YRG9_DREPO|nr:hypothetical protein DPMN_080488 [Dreissena polymorpha]
MSLHTKFGRFLNKTNVLTNFHDDWAKMLTSRPNNENCPPPPPRHVIQLTGTIFEFHSHIKETNVLTKFHENWANNVTSRKNAPPTGGHVFSPIWTIFKLVRDINKTNVLTNFHDDWGKIVTSRVFTRKTAPPPLPPGSHDIQLTGAELNSHIKETNVLTKFHENWAKNVTSECSHKNAPPTGGHVFSPIWTILELDDWAKIVTSRVFTRKTACPLAAIFELDRDIIGTNRLTKFHEDRTINVASRVFTNKCGRTDGRQTKTGHKMKMHFHKDWTINLDTRVLTR